MSIPGLGNLGSTVNSSNSPSGLSSGGPNKNNSGSNAATTTVALQPFWEYRFQVSASSSITIRLAHGTAEKEGAELAPNTAYTFSGVKTKINTWHGCELEVTLPSISGSSAAASYDAYVSEHGAEGTPMPSYLNLHMKLEGIRKAAARLSKSVDHHLATDAAMGPRVLVVGSASTGKTSLVKTLTAWAMRMGSQPMVVNTDSTQGMLSLPGTTSAAVFATIIDITSDWGGTPSSGPTAVPVKLPLAYYYGLESPKQNFKFFQNLLSRLAMATMNRLAEDTAVCSSGLIVDTEAVPSSPDGLFDNQSFDRYYNVLSRIIDEFSINIIVALGSQSLRDEITRRVETSKTRHDQPVVVLGLDTSDGVVVKSDSFIQAERERAIKEYFFGSATRTLSPFTQSVSFDDLSIWTIVEDAEVKSESANDDYSPLTSSTLSSLRKLDKPSLDMLNCIMAVVYADQHDNEDFIKDASVMGFVYVVEVDENRRRLKLLAPVSARLGDRPLVWGSFPEAMVSLLD